MKTVVLVGAGHAHLHLLTRARDYRDCGARLLVIDPGCFWYSGLATGMLGGQYDAADDQIDIAALARACAADFLPGRVVAVDRSARRLELADGSSVGYDLLSLNLGSQVSLPAGADLSGESVYPVKPISALWTLREDLETRWQRGESPRLAVVGGGATGCEVSANLLALAERRAQDLTLHLLHGGERLLSAAPPGASEAITRLLRSRGAEIHLRSQLVGREGTDLRVQLADPTARDEVLTAANNGPAENVLGNNKIPPETIPATNKIPADILVLATGLKAHPLTGELGLPADARGGLHISVQLNSPADSSVFAVGDCAHMPGQPLPKFGVFGVRQAPILHYNLLATLKAAQLKRYVPQSRWLSILNLGEGCGLALRGSRWWLGASSMRLKHWLDRRFMARYQKATSGAAEGQRF